MTIRFLEDDGGGSIPITERRTSLRNRANLFISIILLSTNLIVIESVLIHGGGSGTGGVVRLAVIAPLDPHHEQALPRVLPAVSLAVRAVISPKGSLPGWTIKVEHRDSQCSSTYGPLAAFEFYINRTAGQFNRNKKIYQSMDHRAKLHYS